MNPMLKQLSMALGGIVFFITVITGYLSGASLLVVLIRGLVALTVSSIVIMLFFRNFMAVLSDFIAERIEAQRRAKLAADAAARKSPPL